MLGLLRSSAAMSCYVADFKSLIPWYHAALENHAGVSVKLAETSSPLRAAEQP